MKEDPIPTNKRLSELLPTHTPDKGAWDRISSQLDLADADTAFRKKLDNLPVHSPDPQTWSRIYSRLNRAAYYKFGLRAGLSAAAGLLLFFTVTRFINPSPDDTRVTGLNVPFELTTPVARPETGASIEKPLKESATLAKNIPVAIKQADTHIALPEMHQLDQPGIENEFIVAMDIPEAGENIYPEIAESQIIVDDSNFENTVTPSAQTSILFEKSDQKIAVYPQSYTPVVPQHESRGNFFALGMNYLPENVDNGTENTMFHNLALTASYNKEKTRFNTSLGMAYNEDQFSFEMNYEVKTPVTAYGPDGRLDTVSYNISQMDSEFSGTEKHQYVTYNLGIGKRLFKLGKFSSWINAGAGFGIQINNPDLIETTSQTIKGMPATQLNSVYTEKPEYTDYNINFITGIDFNYQIIKHLSISFAPTSRWYFKPLLLKDNQPTDELSIGFTTGMKFDF